MSIIAWGARGLAVIRLRDPHSAAPSVPVATLTASTPSAARQSSVSSQALPAEISTASAIPSISDLIPHNATQDPSDTIMARVKAGISLDPAKNHVLLRKEVAMSRTVDGTGASGARHVAATQLLLMYEWLERILPLLTQSHFEQHAVFCRLTAAEMFSDEDACGPLTAYISDLRKLALTQCGWSPLPGRDVAATVLAELARRPLVTIAEVAALIPVPIVTQSCEDGEYERAAAVAMLHGYSGPAVELLNLAAAEVRSKISFVAPTSAQTLAQYASTVSNLSIHAELLQLTAMAIAGCPGPALDSEASRVGYSATLEMAQRDANRQVWLNSCRTLMTRIEGRKHPYLKICLAVLIEVADPALETTPMSATASPAVNFAVAGPMFKEKEKTPRGALPKRDSIASADVGTVTTVGAAANTKKWPAHRLDTLTTRRQNTDMSEKDRSVFSTPLVGATPRVQLASPAGAGIEVPKSVSDLNLDNASGAKLDAKLTLSSQMRAASGISLDDMALPPPAAPSHVEHDDKSIDSDDEEHIEICLNDRVAFACRFLSDAPLPDYIETITTECVDAGRIDGLLLTGLTSRGAQLVQRYLDQTADVQTAAIVGCYLLRVAQLRIARGLQRRAAPPSPALDESLLSKADWAMVAKCWRWVQSYRELLSKSQLWNDRAKFDVLRSKLFNIQFKGYIPTSAAAVRHVQQGTESDAEKDAFQLLLARASYANGLFPQPALVDCSRPKPLDPTVTLDEHQDEARKQQELARFATNGILDLGAKRSQLVVRCASCRASLSLPALVEGSASAVDWLTKQRPFMLACPSCRKPLPKCSLCLLPLGSINPVLQLQHEMKLRNSVKAAVGLPSGDTAGKQESLMDMSPAGHLRDAMNFDDFWCWCQSCKHGGHASHLAEWFASKSVCPVAECMCHCIKMDGFASSLEGIKPTLLTSGSIARWGAPFSGGKITLEAGTKATT